MAFEGSNTLMFRKADPKRHAREQLSERGLDRAIANLLGLYLYGVTPAARALAHMTIADVIVDAASKAKQRGAERTGPSDDTDDVLDLA